MNDKPNISPEILDILKMGIAMAKQTITKNEETLHTFITKGTNDIALEDIGKLAVENVELKEKILLSETFISNNSENPYIYI